MHCLLAVQIKSRLLDGLIKKRDLRDFFVKYRTIKQNRGKRNDNQAVAQSLFDSQKHKLKLSNEEAYTLLEDRYGGNEVGLHLSLGNLNE